ncbi:unnamed protein product [Didymodactylos carnosus]|uniref:Uncharacterized protein n=1 Tax=Didymodactylos carnosus TaxID=1234261 RepID=A0A816A8D4_9BILA|nr:unnamed protein product [Didymodactylos carnosus]CAF1628809.1 unnamed protein product [Didymodactylos carnosus]CAF4453652.1 unnamed protein product [Didymodactylos carnosus]CAF4465504.1 unnamed protein product [Didymodactylos carnosus]
MLQLHDPNVVKLRQNFPVESSISWFRGAIGLALIPLDIVPKTWTDSMSEYPPDDLLATTFTECLTDTYTVDNCD